MIDGQPWMVEANCIGTDPEAFFPKAGTNPSRTALRVCHACPVQSECLAYAMEVGESGIWGGTSEAQRIRAGGRSSRRPVAEFETHCRAGHPRTAENTYIRSNGTRTCRSCRSESRRAAKNGA